MDTLGLTKFKLRIVGIDVDKTNSKVLIVFFLFVVIHHCIAQTIFVYINIKDIEKITDTLYTLGSAYGYTIKYIISIYHSKDIKKIIDTLTSLVNLASANEEEKIHMENIEKKISYYSNLYTKSFSIVAVAFIFKPVGKYIIARYTGEDTTEILVSPYNNAYFIDVYWTPLIETTYLLFVMSTLTFILLLCTIDLFYCAITWYIMEIYDLLAKRLAEIDTYGDHYVNNKKRKETIVFCVKIQKTIIRFFKESNTLIGRYIITQYWYEAFALGCNVFQLKLDAALFFPLVLLFAIESGLFVFCVCGTFLLDKGRDLSDHIYAINWYNYSPREREMLKLMMFRSMKPPSFHYSIFECNLSNFVQINRAAFSAFALLQNLDR